MAPGDGVSRRSATGGTYDGLYDGTGPYASIQAAYPAGVQQGQLRGERVEDDPPHVAHRLFESAAAEVRRATDELITGRVYRDVGLDPAEAVPARDILEFIALKLDPVRMRNFNLSVAATDAFASFTEP